MKNIELNGQQIAIPSTWAEITFGDYERWSATKCKDQLGDIQHVANICNMDTNILSEVSAEKFQEIKECISFIFESEFEPSQSIKIGKNTYQVSPYEEITLGEWVAFDSINSEQRITSLSDSLAIICRPLGERYDQTKAMKRAKLFREQSCDIILPLVSFFSSREQQSQEIVSHSLQVVVAVNQFLQDAKAFTTSEDSIKRLPFWKRIRYANLTKSLEKQLERFSDSYAVG